MTSTETVRALLSDLTLETEQAAAERGEPAIVTRDDEDRWRFVGVVAYVAQLARTGRTPAAGLGAAYSFLFGVEPTQRHYPLLGKLGQLLGRQAAALLLLEFITQPDPLVTAAAEVIGRASARAGGTGWRPEDAPALETLAAERKQLERQAWILRMRRSRRPTPEAERGDVRLSEAQRQDIARWVTEGRPNLWDA